MSSAISDNKSQTTYIYKQQKLYGKVERGQYYLFENGDYILANDKVSEITDILPEGIDLQIMMNSFNAKQPIELLPYLKNTIGDFDFSTSPDKTYFDKPMLSNIALESKFPKGANLTIKCRMIWILRSFHSLRMTESKKSPIALLICVILLQVAKQRDLSPIHDLKQ